jgi:hypothetical protein
MVPLGCGEVAHRAVCDALVRAIAEVDPRHGQPLLSRGEAPLTADSTIADTVVVRQEA